MIVSRLFPILKFNSRTPKQVLQSIRHSSNGFSYRSGPRPEDSPLVLPAEIIQGFAWWWVLWHFWTEPGHIFGEFDYPDPSKWTDAELGIPFE